MFDSKLRVFGCWTFGWPKGAINLREIDGKNMYKDMWRWHFMISECVQKQNQRFKD